MKRIISFVLGLIGVMVGLGFILPALARLKADGAMPHIALGSLGVLLVLGGVGVAMYGFRKRRA